MTSGYLEIPPRPYPPLLRDHQPDILFHGDALKRARHRELSTAAFLRRNVHHFRTVGREITAEEWQWIKDARKAHSKAILNAREYDRLIMQREMARIVSRITEGYV